MLDEVCVVYDDIMYICNVDWISNFWKIIVSYLLILRCIWDSFKEIMVDGVLDVRIKEMVYFVISVNNGCDYCIVSYSVLVCWVGMIDEMFGELMVVVGMVNEIN